MPVLPILYETATVYKPAFLATGQGYSLEISGTRAYLILYFWATVGCAWMKIRK